MTNSDSTRRQPRFGVELDLSLDSETHFFAGTATNLSLGGFFVATFIQQQIGERFSFTIELPGDNKKIKGLGEVRWLRSKSESSAEPAGMGIRFVEFTGDSKALLEEYLASPKDQT